MSTQKYMWVMLPWHVHFKDHAPSIAEQSRR